MSTTSINQKGAGLAGVISENQEKIVSDWMREMNAATRRSDLINEADLKAQCAQFLHHTKQALANGADANLQSAAWSNVRQMLDEVSKSRAQQGFSPAETAMFVLSAKRPIFTLIR